MIVFPVIRRIEVSAYQLFENDQSQGISHNFEKGVHAIVGINGLGKTTLLNMLYRVLLGPNDMSKDDDTGLASTQHKLSDWRNSKFFRSRVRDEARRAWIEADVTFGEHEITIRRSLRTLEITKLIVDEEERDASQDVYESVVLELSNLATYFDFFAVLRHLIFFLEDRAELIWDKRSQFDMFRILFYDRDAACKAAEAYDGAQAADSRFRNLRVPYNKASKRLTALRAAESSPDAVEQRARHGALLAAELRDRDQIEEVERLKRIAEASRLRIEKARLDLEEARHAFEHEQALFYKHVFPRLEPAAEYIFLNLLGDGGCLVCGNPAEDASRRLREQLERQECPICGSHAAEQENLPDGEHSKERLHHLASEIDRIRAGLFAQEEVFEAAGSDLRQILERREQDNAALMQMRVEMEADGLSLDVSADDESEIIALEATIRNIEPQMNLEKANRADSERMYKNIVNSQAEHLAIKFGEVKRAFARVARRLLAEKCLLGDDVLERPIGQEGEEFQFPCFEVMMSSGVFRQNLSNREDATSVSESQREFIDLAFRMALIEVASAGQSDAMIVIETPEASLDSLFIGQAGDLFRGFAERQDRRNVFIASTNLNNENMLPALFGLINPPDADDVSLDDLIISHGGAGGDVPAPPSPLSPEEREHRVVNLLELAAPNAALRQHRTYYNARLEAAIYPERSR